ncbi:MAG: hypothetical protein KBS81_01450, partial [Spirochaetales bacterium]|nr:hypothetical protein [Candidatus Physcosoma equi]
MMEEMLETTEEIQKLSSQIEIYAKEHQLTLTSCALPLVLGVLLRSHNGEHYKEASELQLDARHALSTCRMLIDLHPDLSAREEDLLLASDLCRALPQFIRMKNIREELSSLYHLDPEICRIVSIVHRRTDLTEEEFKERIRRVQEDKLALMIVLASRG